MNQHWVTYVAPKAKGQIMSEDLTGRLWELVTCYDQHTIDLEQLILSVNETVQEYYIYSSVYNLQTLIYSAYFSALYFICASGVCCGLYNPSYWEDRIWEWLEDTEPIWGHKTAFRVPALYPRSMWLVTRKPTMSIGVIFTSILQCQMNF